MKGSMRRRGKKGLWVVELRVKKPDGGFRTVRVSTHTADKKAAEAVYRKAVAEYERGAIKRQPTIAHQLTLEAWMREWIAYKRAVRIRESTARQYEDKARLYIWPELGDVALADLTPSDVRGWLVRLSEARKMPPRYKEEPKDPIDLGPVSARTVQLAYTILNAALAQAVKEGKLADNPCAGLERPQIPQYEPHPLGPEEAAALLAAARGTPLEALWVLALASGMRFGELLSLHWEDVDLRRGTVRVRADRTKAGARLLSIADDHGGGPVVDALRAHKASQDATRTTRLAKGQKWQDGGLVFCSRYGTPLLPQNVGRRDWARLLERAGLPPVRRHDLRHTAGSFALRATGDPKAVQHMLGHASEAFFLKVYGHALPGSREAVGAAMAEIVRAAASPPKVVRRQFGDGA